ncbi:AAA family ATPase [Cellulosimicrobium terreum]|nr:AAA family ATPase [Cellulosimicrobium terreum]
MGTPAPFGAPPGPLLGRRRECDELARLVATVRSGRSAALVLSGEAGVGKSALLDHLGENALDCHVVRASGVESEMELVFAGLHQVCAPFLDLLDRLPGPQAAVLRIAFGYEGGDVPDRFFVGLATLSLLSEATGDRPIVCLVDDTQWLDRASVQVLAFVARRLGAEAVAMVFGRRASQTDGDLAGLPELVVEGLADQPARALLRSVVAGLLDEQVLDRIVAETRGNPLALVELTRGLRADELTGGVGPTDGRALPSRVEASFERRVAALPDDVRSLLLLAAAEQSGDPVLLWRAAAHLGIEGTDPDSSDDLLVVRERVLFRHPLARSATYRSASPAARRAAHTALAEVTDRATDPDRWAWHLAAATPGPDEEVAVELERGAVRARARGGVAASAAFLRRSTMLTPDRAARAARALRAAEASLEAGAFDATDDMLVAATTGPLDELQRARVDLVRADAAYSRSRGADGPALMLGAARTLERLDPALARSTYLGAWSAALFAGPLASPGSGLVDVSRAALSAPPAPGPTRPYDVVLEGLSLAMTQGRGAAAPVLRRAVAAYLGDGVTPEEILRFGWLAAAAASMVWDLGSCVTLASRAVQLARRTGALGILAVDLNVLVQQTCLVGDLDSASALVEEAAAVTSATGSQVAPFGAILYLGMRGREAEAMPLLQASERRAHEWGQGVTVQHARWSTAVLYNAQGRHAEAFDAALAAFDDTPELFVSLRAAPELIEAAVKTGRTDEAHRTLDRVIDATQAGGTVLAQGVEARCRAMLAEADTVAGADVDALYREAVDLLGRTPARPELARAHLSYGEWLRRAGRTDDARGQLGAAHDLFVASRMEGYEDRARRALGGLGVRVRGRRTEVLEGLTAHEAEIARLAATGSSNTEIGTKLFVSPRTVEWHLHKVFLKLGISSRKELAAALDP